MGSFKKIEEWLNNVRRYYGVFFSSRWSQGSGNAAGGLSLKQLQEKGAYRLPYMALVGNKSKSHNKCVL